MISDLFGASGRRFLDALVAGERSPKALAALGDKRLRASRAELEEALTGRFRDVHATEIGLHLRLIDAICAEITMLDERIEAQLAEIPRTGAVCASCGLAGRPDSPDRACGAPAPLDLAARLAEITGISQVTARVAIAELGTDPSQFPTPGHAAGWARLIARSRQSGDTAKPGRTGERQPVPALCPRAGRHGRRQDRYPARGDVPADRPQARQIQGHRRGRPRHLRDRLEAHLRPQPGMRNSAPTTTSPQPARQTRARIREIERINPGKKSSSSTPNPTPARLPQRSHAITHHAARCHAT